MEIAVTALEQLQLVVDVMKQWISRGVRIFLLTGELGAGKTALVRAFCEAMDAGDQVSSPTFSLVNAYDTAPYGTIYHMDLYRLTKESDLDQIGFDEYTGSGSICFIEWPDLALPQIDGPYCQILIEQGQDNSRIFKITTYDTMDV